MGYPRAVRVLVLSLLLVCAPAHAQESGGSFGGSSWDEPSSGGGGGGGGWEPSGGSSSWEADREAERAAEREAAARREAEAAAARAAEEARRRAEEEERRRAEEARRARILALPPILRAREVGFPPAPGPAALPDTRAVSAGPAERSARWHVAVEPPEPPLAATYRAPFSWGTASCCGAGLALVLLPLVLFVTRTRRTSGTRRHAAAGPNGLARRVTLAFDWTARAALQAELKAMAQRVDTKGRPGLHRAAHEVVRLLGPHLGAARYATWELSSGDPRSWFQSRVTDLRSRFTTDRVRQIDGQARGAGSGAHVARPEEGEGLVVVSVLLASKAPMSFPAGVARAEDVGAVLASVVPASPDHVLALEVIWSPSEENDRMSSLELERFYPELMPLGSGVGRHVCGYCRAPFPLELGRCPACGAPVAPVER
jgi:uncharacterized membrane protein